MQPAAPLLLQQSDALVIALDFDLPHFGPLIFIPRFLLPTRAINSVPVTNKQHTDWLTWGEFTKAGKYLANVQEIRKRMYGLYPRLKQEGKKRPTLLTRLPSFLHMKYAMKFCQLFLLLVQVSVLSPAYVYVQFSSSFSMIL